MSSFKTSLLSSLIILVACGSESVEDQTTELVGTWKSTCFDAYTSATRTDYHIETYQFTADTYSFEYEEYSDSECLELVSRSNGESFSDQGDYVVGDRVTSGDGTEVNEITFTWLYDEGGATETPVSEVYLFTIIDDVFYKSRSLSDESVDYDLPYQMQLDIEK